MFPNLRAEMARKGITSKRLSIVIGVSPKTLSNKLYGRSEFTLAEMLAIKNRLFPDLSLDYLFEQKEVITA